MQYMVFRTSSEERDWIWDEIRRGNLRQGFGIEGTQLIENGEIVKQDIWVKRYQDNSIRYWGEKDSNDKSISRYWILWSLTQLNEGDTLIIPKMPKWDTFTLAIVDRPYEFDYTPASQRDDDDDFRHIIPLKVESIRYFNYSFSEETKIIYSKIRGYQAAVNNVRNNDVINAVNKLITQQSSDLPKNIIDIYHVIKDDALRNLLDRMRNLSPNDLEQLVANIFENNNYSILERNVFDGLGGDADIILTNKLPIISDFSENDLKIFIQVKQKVGIDNNDMEGINQLVNISSKDTNVIKILASTCDDFTDQARKLAEENNVVLLKGMDLVRLMAKHL